MKKDFKIFLFISSTLLVIFFINIYNGTFQKIKINNIVNEILLSNKNVWLKLEEMIPIIEDYSSVEDVRITNIAFIVEYKHGMQRSWLVPPSMK